MGVVESTKNVGWIRISEDGKRDGERKKREGTYNRELVRIF